MFDRLKTENLILGAIIYHNGYAQVAHILAPSNFSSLPAIENRGLYTVIRGLFPDRQIDVLTVAHEIRTKFPQDVTLMSTLLNTGHHVTSAANIVQWAFQLLQYDITMKFQRQLADWHAERKYNHDDVEAAIILDIINVLDPDLDVFESIDNITRYFKSLDMEREFNACMQFYKDLSTKVKKTKEMNTIENALRYIYQALPTEEIAQQHCKIFADAIASILINQNIDPKFTQAANLITQ